MGIERDTFTDVHPTVEEVRLYWDNDESGPQLPSVTTILETRDDDKSNIHRWQDENDGVGDNADYRHLLWYSQQRGTLCHWYALKTLYPSLEWTPDEARAIYEIGNVNSLNDPIKYPLVHDATAEDVLYSVYRNQDRVRTHGDFIDRYGDDPECDFENAVKEQYERDRDFFVEAFERVCSKLDITHDNTISVEQYLLDYEYNYGGQVDLVYRDGDDVVVADLKTSSGCYTKHKLQGAAYAKAIERDDDIDAQTVDRLEVIRIDPDTGQYAVHTNDVTHGCHVADYWNRSYDDLWNEFADLATAFEYDESE